MTYESPDQQAEGAAYRPPGQRFPRVQFRTSYDIGSVDTFFATIATRSSFEIRAVRLPTGFFGRGYSMVEVNRSLEWWARKKAVGG